MAITAEQAAQLASTYQTGDTSGLQGLINQMGVTQADVAQYFPGFDVGSLQGITLPSAPNYSNLVSNLGAGAQEKFNKFADIISSGGSLTESQEAKLAKLSGKAEQDLAAALNYTPTSSLYSYTPPTYGPQNVSGADISSFIQANLGDPGKIAQAAQQFGISSADIAAATGYKPEQQFNYFQQAGMLPTTSAFDYDLFPELGESQERKLEKFVNMLALGQELSPEQAKKLTKFGATTGYDFLNIPTYKSLEEQLAERAGGTTFQAITDYVGQNLQDPTKIYQRAAELGITPEDVLLAYSATGKKGQSPYSFQQIKDYFETGKAGYGTAFDNLLASTFGTDNVAEAKAIFKPEDFTNKSIESIQEALRSSSQNKIQDAFNLSSALYGYTDKDGNQVAGVFGFDPSQKLGAAKDLASGTFEDNTIKQIYNELLKTNRLTPELQTKLMQHLAKTNPDAYVFEKNPELRTLYTPIEQLIDAPKQPGQYGYYETKNGDAPLLSATEAKRLVGDDVFKGGNNYFGYGSEGAKDNSLGWDLRSKYAGSIARGAGIFNVKANANDIALFDKAEREIAKYGGVQTQVDPEGGTRQVVAVPGKDPETGQPYTNYVPVESFFLTSDYDPETGTGDNKYNLYLNTKENLAKGADQLKLDPTKFGSTADLFRAVNDRTSNLYVVTGRTNKWDKTVSEELGLTGHDRDRGGINHASVLYREVGDKLVPVEILKTFNFDDPETSKGFFGDLLGDIGQILSIPPIQLALIAAGGLPNILSNLAGTTAANVAASVGSSVLDNIGIGSLLANTGMSYAQIGALESLVGNALLQGGTSGLMTGMATGDLEAALTSGLAGMVGAGVGGATQFGLGPGSPFNFAQDLNLSPAALRAASEVLGGSAARAVTGQDPGEYAANRLLNLGIGALVGTGAEKAGIPTKGPGVDIFKAMLPIITSKNVRPEDIFKLAEALDKSGYLKTATA